jgi:hypothetical protein
MLDAKLLVSHLFHDEAVERMGTLMVWASDQIPGRTVRAGQRGREFSHPRNGALGKQPAIDTRQRTEITGWEPFSGRGV